MKCVFVICNGYATSSIVHCVLGSLGILIFNILIQRNLIYL